VIRGYVDALTNKPTSLRLRQVPDSRLVTVVGVPRLAERPPTTASPTPPGSCWPSSTSSLGCMNMIPLPAVRRRPRRHRTYEAIRSRRGKRYYADITKMLPASYIALAAIALVVFGSLYLDIAKPIGG
jgi:hypothetical protein